MRRLTPLLIGLGLLPSFIIGTIIVNTYLPVVLANLGANASQIALALTWDNYLAVLTVAGIGFLSDRTRTPLGRRRPWVLGTLPVIIAALVALPMAGAVLPILAILFVLNLAGAAYRVPAQSLLGDLIPTERQSQANAINSIVVCLIGIPAFLVMGSAFEQSGLGGVVPIAAAIIVLASLCILVGIREPQPSQAVAAAAPGASPSGLWRTLRSSRSLLFLGGVFFLLCALGAIESWIAAYGQLGIGIPADKISMAQAAGTLGVLLSAVPVGILARRKGEWLVALLGAGILVVAYTLSAFFVRDLLSLGVLMAVVSFGSTTLYVTLLPLFYRTFPNAERGAVTSLYFAVYNLAFAVGPQLVGAFIDLSGVYQSLFWFAAASMCLGFLLLWHNRRVVAPVATTAPATLAGD